MWNFLGKINVVLMYYKEISSVSWTDHRFVSLEIFVQLMRTLKRALLNGFQDFPSRFRQFTCVVFFLLAFLMRIFQAKMSNLCNKCVSQTQTPFFLVSSDCLHLFIHSIRHSSFSQIYVCLFISREQEEIWKL